MKREDIQKILLIGSGPIVIGQGCEFDYSGTQACKALREDGYFVILVNSNPATIMTDPETADRTYIEPLTVESLEKIIAKERPCALLPTLGGQTGLNLAMDLFHGGILKKYNVEMLGADAKVIHTAEDRQEFKKAMTEIGLESAKSKVAYTPEEARVIGHSLGYPCVVRPAYTLGGTGGGIARTEQDLNAIVADGLRCSPVCEVLIEESIIGWKEYELEVMRDKKDNVVIVCSIENLDAMGVHTGDSITVAPAQTLTDREYQKMRDAAIAIMRKIGVETGGSNVQFSVNPRDGRMVVIEMNPRVSRSSALASKATGFPIAKFAAKLAVGYTLDEIKNDITKETPACFEPTIDYVVTKIPRFNFDKFKGAKAELGTAMKSVGEIMSIGRTFKESFQKGLRSMENKGFGFGFDGQDFSKKDIPVLIEKLKTPNHERLLYIKLALEQGFNVSQLHEFTGIDPWFLHQMKQIVDLSEEITDDAASIRQAKEYGFSDRQLARLLKYKDEMKFRSRREELGIQPVYKLVDTCAGEFEAYTPYYYSTYEVEDEVQVQDEPKVMILGGGPNRIGQGIEFDYCCVHASMALRASGIKSIMVNSNPETVSTDYDISDRLYFEPLTFEDVLNIYNKEKPLGIIAQFGGQTPLNLAMKLQEAGVKILGTSPESIDQAEDRQKFQQMLHKVNLKQPENTTVFSLKEAKTAADGLYPVVVRPSYVLGGASMKICYNEAQLVGYMRDASQVSPEHPILIDKYLENAIEIDVDGLCDGKSCIIAGVMEHIEEAGIHSGDSACTLPPFTLSGDMIDTIKEATKAMALELNVIGLINVQFAVKDSELYVIEVNPRASRTVPFVSKATGKQWAKLATKVMLGKSIAELKLTDQKMKHWSVKEAVFPFRKFPGTDPLLSPEMKSTGEVMGIDGDLGMAFFKAQQSAYNALPSEGCTVYAYQRETPQFQEIVSEFKKIGCQVKLLKDISDCQTATEHFASQEKDKLILSFMTKDPSENESDLRLSALAYNIPFFTTERGARSAIEAMKSSRSNAFEVIPLQEYY